MKIAVIGWGSLVWNPETLLVSENWHNDGPSLPVEFARVSSLGRLTLVLYPTANYVQSLWNLSSYSTLPEALENLRRRERTPDISNIGFMEVQSGEHRCAAVPSLATEIKRWALSKGVDAVIWTDLSSNFSKKLHRDLDETNVIKYLKELPDNQKEEARNYIQKAPVQIETRFRAAIRRELRW